MEERKDKLAGTILDDLRKSSDEIDAILNSLKESLVGIDPVDLLAKVNVSSIVLRSNFLLDYNNYSREWKKYRDAFCFLFAFYLVYSVDCGEKKISLVELNSLVQTIDGLLFNRNLENESDEESLIGYGQTEITEILLPFRFLEIQTLCKKLDGVILDEFSIDSDCLILDLYNFLSGIFRPKRDGGISFEYFIENFDEFFDESDFEFTGESRTIIESVSGEIGSQNHIPFNINTPLSILDKSKKCFLNINGHLYSFDDGLLASRFCKYLERTLNTSQVRQIIINDAKASWSEELTRKLFEQHLPGGQYFQNNHYFLSKKDRFENDGLYIFNGIVFVIEVKAGKLSPESVYENQQEVIESYRRQVEKGINQCLRTANYINKSENSIFYNQRNEEQLKINRSAFNRVISVCITFEEEKCFLPGFQARDNHSNDITPVVINFYDLAVVFDYLSSPTLIAKYLYERSLPVNEKRLYIDDELTLLGMFTNTSVNLSGILNHPIDGINNHISNIYFDDSDFAHEIEMHCENNEPKPDFNIHPMLMNLIMEADKQLDKDLLDLLIEILSESQKCLESLFVKFRKRNNSGGFAPQTLRAIDRSGTNKEKALVFMKHPSSPFDKKKALGYLSNRFSTHASLGTMFVAFFKRDNVELKKYQKSDEIFNDPEVKQLGDSMKLFILEHKLD